MGSKIREWVQNGLEVAQMLDFEFLESLVLKRSYLGHFKRFFFAIFLRERESDELHYCMLTWRICFSSHFLDVLESSEFDFRGVEKFLRSPIFDPNAPVTNLILFLKISLILALQN